jgi:hypothetical protein
MPVTARHQESYAVIAVPRNRPHLIIAVDSADITSSSCSSRRQARGDIVTETDPPPCESCEHCVDMPGAGRLLFRKEGFNFVPT